MEFFKFSTENKCNPTVEYLRNCIALISDLAQFYGNRVTQLVKQ